MPLPHLISLILHGVFLLVLFLGTSSPEQKNPTPILVDYLERQSVSELGKKEKGSKPLSYQDLEFRNDPVVRGFIGPKSAAGENRELGQGWSEDDFGAGGLQFENIEDYLQIKRIAEEIDGLLFYPGALASKDLEGGVNARVPFRPRGGCDQKGMAIESGSLYFRVYILALLKKFCRIPQIDQMRLARTTRVDLNFLFLVVDPSEKKEFPSFKIAGDTVTFERHHAKLPLELRLGPLRIWGPYVAVDFPYLFEKWEMLTKGKDPLQEFR